MSEPKISICTPAHQIPETDYFLGRLKESLDKQTFRDFEWIVTWDGSMPVNSNSAIKKARGEIIKILYMDDFLHSEYALEHLVDNWQGGWLASGCIHTQDGKSFYDFHIPRWNPEVKYGKNTIGSPSVIAFDNDNPLLFDENLSWLLDCELYGRLYERYGQPHILPFADIAIGIGPHQTTNTMSNEDKMKEHEYITAR